jgi:O-antigen ligase
MPRKRHHPLITALHTLDKYGETLLNILAITLIGAILLQITLSLGGWIYMGRPLLWPMVLSGALSGIHGLWWLAYRKQQRSIRLWALALWPFFLYLLLHLWWFSPTPWWAVLEVYYWFQALLIIWVIAHQFSGRRSIWILLGIALSICIYTLWLGFRQYFSEPEWLPLGRTLPAQYAGRMTGPFGVPNHLGALLALFIPGTLVAALLPRFPLGPRIGTGFLALLMLFGLFLTGSRGAMIAVGVALLLLPVFLLASWRHRLMAFGQIFLILVAAGAVGSFLFPQIGERFARLVDEGGESTRKVMWAGAANIWLAHPFTGSGWGSFTERWDNYRPPGSRMDPEFAHNDFLNVLADGGLAGFVLLFSPLAVLGWCVLRHWRAIPFIQFTPDQERRLLNVLGRNYHPLETLTGSERLERARDGRFMPLRKANEVVGPGRMPTAKILLGGILLGFIAFALQLLVEFSLKIPALVVFASTLGACALRELPGLRWSGSSPALLRLLPALTFLLGGTALALSSVTILKAQEEHFHAREKLQKILREPALILAEPEILRQAGRGFDYALRLNPHHGDAWYGRAMVLLQKFRSRPEQHAQHAQSALDALSQAIKLDPSNPDYWAAQGMALGMLPAPAAQTEAAYRKAIDLAPNKPDLHYFLANYLSLFPDRQNEAAQSARQALALDPYHTAAQKLLDSLALF